jgi:hypothetical protein
VAEFQHLLEKYHHEGWRLWSQRLGATEWGDVPAARGYLERYWLPSADLSEWHTRAESVFGAQALSATEPVFPDDWKLRPMLGGVVMIESQWVALRRLAGLAGDQEIAVLEKFGSAESDDPPIRLRFPVTATWQDLLSGNFMSSIVFEMLYKEYLVLGNSGSWGMFSATEHEMPFNIVALTGALDALVGDEFRATPDEWATIRDMLPEQYRRC